ncbi:hypothetical protein [Thermoplasma sp. Kam2015]|uniref:hypothetical protein n=1 Tax=Thermoplasma sp. Kam2015 TaxID=2094122 RepID=UPI001F473622|nr:hypothetical protein [Thermoplasma sp. Kam2015]
MHPITIKMHDVVLGLIVAAIGGIVFTVSLYLGIANMIIGIILLFFGLEVQIPLGAKQDVRFEGKVRYEWAIKEGLARIADGRMHVDKGAFLSIMEKSKEALNYADNIPEFGMEAIYLYFSNRERAAHIADQLRSAGIDADVQDDKVGSTLKISFTRK